MGATAALAQSTEPENDVGMWGIPAVAIDWGTAAHAMVGLAAGDPLGGDPTSLREAQAAPDWLEWEKAIEVEMENLRMHETYELVVKPPGARTIGCTLVFHRKRDAEGAVTQHKVRVVAQGFAQVPGLEFDRTFAPVAKPSSLKLICAHPYPPHLLTLTTLSPRQRFLFRH